MPAAAPACSACPFRTGLPASCNPGGPQAVAAFRTHAAGARIFRAGESSRGVYVLTRGLIAIQRNTVQGETMILRLLFPISPFGIEAWALGRRHDSDAVALVESAVCRLDPAHVQKFLALHPKGGIALIERLAADLLASEETSLMVGKEPVRERFEKLLRRLLEEARDRAPSQVWPGAQRFRLPCSRQQLAAMLGVRPETLSRAIRKAEREGWLRLEGRRADVRLPRAGAREQPPPQQLLRDLHRVGRGALA